MLARPSMLIGALCLTFLAVAATGCDPSQDEDIGGAEAQPFVDGVAKDTEGGAFRVTLTSRDGLAVGDNGLIVRVGFHDPNDPLAPGRGIPEAEVQLDGWTSLGEFATSVGDPVYLGDGEYFFEDLELAEGGVWNFDISIAVGATMDESVSFAFVIPDEDM
ncbi:MAG: hypothetical protein KC457_24425 [Myxococcales bacterium]|nr:hypothetical protein [Myxococcales bacterium]